MSNIMKIAVLYTIKHLHILLGTDCLQRLQLIMHQAMAAVQGHSFPEGDVAVLH